MSASSGGGAFRVPTWSLLTGSTQKSGQSIAPAAEVISRSGPIQRPGHFGLRLIQSHWTKIKNIFFYLISALVASIHPQRFEES